MLSVGPDWPKQPSLSGHRSDCCFVPDAVMCGARRHPAKLHFTQLNGVFGHAATLGLPLNLSGVFEV